jgi:hypothetical protein
LEKVEFLVYPNKEFYPIPFEEWVLHVGLYHCCVKIKSVYFFWNRQIFAILFSQFQDEECKG